VKQFIAGSLCAIALIAITLTIYLGLGFLAVAADETPPAWETSLMTAAVHASVARRAGEATLSHADDAVIAGGKIYLDDCIGCHGAPGQPPSKFGASFYPRAPQFPLVGSQYTDAQLLWVSKHGIRMTGMSAQGAGYSDAELATIVAFIERIRNLSPAMLKAAQPPPDQ
jgi:mono/diheme cytochrome c family protein